MAGFALPCAEPRADVRARLSCVRWLVACAQLGLIAGGLVDGTVNLWNPAQIVGAVGSEEPGSAGDGALVANLQKHSGAVRAFALAAPASARARHVAVLRGARTPDV